MNALRKLLMGFVLCMFVCAGHTCVAEEPQVKKALIIGITGQDGSYLAQLLLTKGYEVHGVLRRSSSPNTARIDHLLEEEALFREHQTLFLHYGDVTDAVNMMHIIQKVQPDEIYNLSAQSHVHVSFELPQYTAAVDGLGVLHLLEAIRILGLQKKTKFYQASTSELYGKVQAIPQSETTPFYPRSPYAVAKLYGFWIVKNYREAYDMFCCNGILFNHESPVRGDTFVTKKIAHAVACIKCGLQDVLYLGNLNAQRDWGHAKDYVEAMWLMLQQSVPDDYVIATGETHSVREFVELSFKEVGIDIKWVGEGVDEVGVDVSTGKIIVMIDPYFFRPAEVDLLIGDASKARNLLGWQSKVTFHELVKDMVNGEMQRIGRSPRDIHLHRNPHVFVQQADLY